MNYEKTKELVKSGHQLVVLLGKQNGMHEAASLVQRMAGQLDVLIAVLREKTKQCEQIAQAVGWVEGGNFTLAEAVAGHVSGLKAATQRSEELAAENAALKAGVKYFSYSEMAGFEEHSTADLAQKSADADLAGERDEASSEGWSEETDTICWGVILQKAVENKFEKPSEENGWIGWSDYALLPNIETPATDAFLREVRASAVDAVCLKISNSIVSCRQDEMIGLDEAVNIASDYATELRQGGAA
ncbi:Rossmann-fold NAD(P)-binding domain-containing protein [Cronobacter sakazakii]|uniref:hypothetical protein n=1 Tax=Cronobacter sakazakii TaxID=28141 RepID=UPI000CFABE4D|nr:hypothetical protein [Cronobacter sakazakii]